MTQAGETMQAVSGPDPIDDRSDFGARTPSPSARLAWVLCGLHARFRVPGKALWKTLGRRHPGPFDYRVSGMQLRIYPTENFGDRTIAFRGRLPETEEMNMIAPHLHEGGCFIDIGANIGIYSIFASRRLGPHGRVLAFEPHPLTARKLAFNLAANHCGNVETCNFALGESNGEVRFYPDDGKNAGRSSILKEAVGNPGGAITVKMRRLSEVIDEFRLPPADLLKIDVEGYEDRVLMPFLDDTPADRWPAALLLEDAHRDLWQSDLEASLLSRGYRQASRSETNMLFLRDRGETPGTTKQKRNGQWLH